MERFVDEEFDGVISWVTGFGIFVELDNTVEGLVHIRSLNGYFEYIDDKIMATCKRRIHFYDCGTTPFATNGTGQPVVLTVSGGAS